MRQIYKTCKSCNHSEWVQYLSLTPKRRLSADWICDTCQEKENKKDKGKNIMTTAKQNQAYMAGLTGGGIDHWDSELETVKDCSKAPEKLKVWITPLAKVKIDALMEKYPSIEWFAYLLGDGEDKFTVVDIHVPTQTITATSVDEIECEDYNKLPIIGAIHSHHGMGTGFSGTDHAFVNQNHNISLVISKAAIAGQVRWSTPCGCLKILDAVVKPKIEVDFDKKAFLKDVTPNINKKEYTPRHVPKYVNGYPTAGANGGTWTNGRWVPHSEAQSSYTNGRSVKDIAQDAAKKKEESGETEEQENVTIKDESLQEQSLMEALDEAFPEREEQKSS